MVYLLKKFMKTLMSKKGFYIAQEMKIYEEIF